MDKHCLRPEFTHQLLALLQQGQSIHLISPHGQGRRRTLQDLRHILPKTWHILHVDMRDVEKRQVSLLHALLEQVSIATSTDYPNLIAKMNDTAMHHLIIIHNVEYLTDAHAIACLNDIEIYPYVALLYVSEKQQQTSIWKATDCILPVLTTEQLLAEIKWRDLALEQYDMQLLLDFLLQQTSPYSLLDTKPKTWFSNGLWKAMLQQKGLHYV